MVSSPFHVPKYHTRTCPRTQEEISPFFNFSHAREGDSALPLQFPGLLGQVGQGGTVEVVLDEPV